MIYDIEKFGTDLQSTYNEELGLQNPPLTYEAYNAALRQYLYEFKSEVINMEKDIMKQGKLIYMTYLFVIIIILPFY